MSDTLTEQQLEKLKKLYTALDELKERFLSLTDAGKALQQSFETATTAFLSKPRISPVLVRYPAEQMENGQPGTAQQRTGQQGRIADFLLNTMKKTGEKLLGISLDQLGKTPGKNEPGGQSTRPSAHTGTKIALGLFASTAMAYVTDKLRSSAGSGPAKPAQGAGPNAARQAASSIAALPVFVTNWQDWQAGPGTVRQGAEKGGSVQNTLEEIGSTLAAEGVNKAINFVSKKISGAGGVMSLIGKIPSFLPASRLSALATMGRVGAALAAPVGAASAATTASLVAATAAAGYGIGTLLNKGMGWISGKLTGGKYSGEGWMGSMLYDYMNPPDTQVQNQNTINVSLKVDKDNRLKAETGDMNTKVNLNRGDFVNNGR